MPLIFNFILTGSINNFEFESLKMSYFFDTHLALTPEQAICSAWSNTDFNMVLAVSTSAPRIVFVLEEGTLVPNFEIARGKSTAKIMKWHPIFHALAIGWDDGTV